MTLESGTELGPYDIVCELGRGGMGEVYRARDRRLDRDVAIKALPEQFALDPDRLARFEREAKTLAQLHHPNVAAIYGVEEHEGASYLVLEYVEGQTLADRLARGPFPIDEAMEIAVQIAAGVEAAHEAGVIHRDLKPGNIIITPDGKAKVLDFGLARSDEPSSTPSASPTDPTITSPAKRPPTGSGVILGTAAYMSPEQARGRPVDKRTDIWSFGVILYEMLTGVSPFVGESVSDSIGAVLHKEIDLDQLPHATPPMVRHVLKRCLHRNRNLRLRDIGDLKIELGEAAGDDTGVASVGGGRKPRIAVTALAGMTVLMFGLGWIASKILTPDTPGSTESQVIFAQIAAPPSAVAAFQHGFALSPDGGTLAFAATEASGQRQIWTRTLDGLEARPIPGTEGGAHPRWSPDGANLAFLAEDELRRVPVNGGQTLVICEAPLCMGAVSWGPDDVILFSSGWGPKARIYKVAATGGAPVVLENLGPASHPEWLADGKHILYQRVLTAEEWELRVGSVENGESLSVEKASRADGDGFTYSAGYVIRNRSDALTVQPFDEATGQLIGSAAAISGVAGTPGAWFAVSATPGRLVGLVRSSPGETGDAGDTPSRFEWFGRDGEQVGVLGPPGRYWTIRLSPDGRRVATNQGWALWVLASSGRRVRVSSGPESFPPVWSPDGTEIISWHAGLGPVRQLAQPGSVPSVLENAKGLVSDISPDGRWLLLRTIASVADLLVYDMHQHTTTPWLATEFDEAQARFSPDGLWVAYVSNAGGRRDVYVRPFKGDGPPVIISTAGGMHPVWRGDGRELFYLSPDGTIMAAEIETTEGSIESGRPKALFRKALNDIAIDDFSPYDVAPDGQRFLLNVPERPLPLLFVQGWEHLVDRG
jgi:Tol biopolymer transport system component